MWHFFITRQDKTSLLQAEKNDAEVNAFSVHKKVSIFILEKEQKTLEKMTI